MRPPRALSQAERALWARVARTAVPLARDRPVSLAEPLVAEPPQPAANTPRLASPRSAKVTPPPVAPRSAQAGLDSHWNRRLASGLLAPELVLDLHGHTLDQAHRRLEAGLAQAKAMGARLVLVVAGRSRPVDPADRAQRRGAIRAKILDWLAAGPHAQDIAAVRGAHRRHGGEGALYLVLRRRR